MLKPFGAFLAIVLLLQLCVWLQPFLPFYIPPALLGLGLLLLLLCFLQRVPTSLLRLSQQLLPHMSVLFVPAILSISLYKQQLLKHWHWLAVALFFSTLLSMYLTGKIALYLQKGREADG